MKKKRGSRFLRILRRAVIFLFLFQLFYIIMLKWVNPPITITQLQRFMEGDGLRRDYVGYGKISGNMKLAVIAAEDQLFLSHGGFDWKSIEKAMEHNGKNPKRIRGGSTISQQVAKNVFLWQGRSWVRKGMEAYFTKMIEWVWGKRRILEVYLNVIETGKGVFGVEAASVQYFGKSASKLSRREAALVAAALPNPRVYAQRPVSSYMNARAGWIIRQMKTLQKDDDIRKLLD